MLLDSTVAAEPAGDGKLFKVCFYKVKESAIYLMIVFPYSVLRSHADSQNRNTPRVQQATPTPLALSLIHI